MLTKKYTKLALQGMIIGSLIIIVIFFTQYFSKVSEIIQQHNNTMGPLIYLVLAIFLILLAWALTYLWNRTKNREILISTLVLIVAILIFAIVTLNDIYAAKNIQLILRENGKEIGMLSCNSLNRTKYIMEQDMVTCNIDAPGYVINSSIETYYRGNLKNITNINLKLFQAQSNADYVLFRFGILTDSGQITEYSSGWESQFYTYEILQEKGKDYLNILLILLPIIIFSIPGTIAAFLAIINHEK